MLCSSRRISLVPIRNCSKDTFKRSSRRRRPEDTFKYHSRRLMESQEDAVRRHRQASFKKMPFRRHLQVSFKLMESQEEEVEDWKWKLKVIMDITFNARQKCYHSYWQMHVANAITLQQHNGQI